MKAEASTDHVATVESSVDETLGVQGRGQGEADRRGASELQERLLPDGEAREPADDRRHPGQRGPAGEAATGDVIDVGATVEDRAIERSLALAQRLVGHARAFAAQLGLPELGDVDLPPIGGSAADQAGLQAAAALYLASELESARLVPAMEVLAGVYATGAMAVDLGPAAPMLLGVWRHRNQRFARPEREAFFARLFGRSDGPGLSSSSGGGSNDRFETLLLELCESLYRLGSSSGLGHQDRGSQVAIAMAAENLISNLSPRSRGMTVYAAGDIVTAIRDAVAIFSHGSVQSAVGASSMWGAVRNTTRSYLNEEVELDAHVRRGQSGQVVLAWLAHAAPQLGVSSGPNVQPDEPVVSAAVSWLQVSLALAERQPAVARR